MAFNKPNKRRVFLRPKSTGLSHHIFSFSQHKDGTIFCHWPNFANTNWISYEETTEGLVLRNLDTPEHAQKLSVHGTGVLHFTSGELNKYPGRIKGFHLLNEEENAIGARHLLTAFLEQPTSDDSGIFQQRASDTPIYCGDLNPFVIQFFAVPQQEPHLKINVLASLHTDYFRMPPTDFEWGLFSLAYHDVIWVAYQTTRIGNWPEKNNIIYQDGYWVPTILEHKQDPETKTGVIDIHMKEPKYELNGEEFVLHLDFSPKT